MFRLELRSVFWIRLPSHLRNPNALGFVVSLPVLISASNLRTTRRPPYPRRCCLGLYILNFGLLRSQPLSVHHRAAGRHTLEDPVMKKMAAKRLSILLPRFIFYFVWACDKNEWSNGKKAMYSPSRSGTRYFETRRARRIRNVRLRGSRIVASGMPVISFHT